jgi:DNA-binding NtrC family response regulator
MGRGRILVVDDDRAVLDSISELLGEDHDVLTALGAEEATAILEREEADVIISDYKMPGTDGLTFLTGAKRDFPHSSRVLMTAYADMDLVIRALNEGEIDRFVAKPFKPFEFKNIVEDCLRISLAKQPEPGGETGKLVIIAHDSQILLTRLRLILSPSFRVLSTSNGLEVIALVSGNPVAALVLGIALEKMDGPTIATYLKKEKQAPFPVVILSGDIACPRGYLDQIGADHWIDYRKPAADQELRDYLKERLS